MQTYTIPQVADLLCITPQVLRQMVERGDIPAIDIGNGRKNLRIREDDLKAFMESRKVVPN